MFNSALYSKIQHHFPLFDRPFDNPIQSQSESAVYLIGGFGPIDAVESEEEEESDELKAEKETQQAMSLGWFDEVIEYDFNSGYFNEITWKGNEGIAGKAAANAYYRKRAEEIDDRMVSELSPI